LSASDKDYDATIVFGRTTDTYDATGRDTGRTGAVPSRDEIARGLAALTGDYLQAPPAYSAKKVQGQRAYDLARQEREVLLTPAAVRVARVELVDCSGPRARVRLTCSAGFYVRSFAHALGELTGAGACLEALRRTRSGEFGLDRAVVLEALQDPGRVDSHLIRIETLLPHLAAVTVTGRGLEHVSHGRELEAADYEPGPLPPSEWVRLLDARGALVGMATGGSRPGSLHPALVLI
jgi:tRNA pseudouridine55 synthase